MSHIWDGIFCILVSSRDTEEINMELSQRYENLKALVTERKEEFTNLMEFIEQDTSYMSCPASTRFHLCKEGGLLEHSVNVAETMIKIKNQLMP